MKEEKENQKKKEEKVNVQETKEKKVSKKTEKAKEEGADNKEVKKAVKKAPAKKTPVKEEATDDKAVKKAPDKKATAKKAVTKETEVESEAKPKKKTSKAKADAKDTTKKDSVSKEDVKEDSIKIEENEKTKQNNARLDTNIAKLKGEKTQDKDSDLNSKSDDTEGIIINEAKEDSESKKRKEKLEEQSELIEKKKKRKSSIIMTSVVVALIVIIIIVAIIIGNLNSTTIESHDFYQWYSGQKVEYKGELTFTRKEGLTELKATDRKVTLDSTPVYYSDEKGKVIFPEDMAIVYPDNNGMMYRINHFADIMQEDGESYLETNLATKTNKTKLENAFLYDGQDLYFFLERTNITVNGITYEVSPLSYAIVRYKQSVEIYNYEVDEYQVIDTTETQDAKVVTDTYTINMSVDSLQTADKDQLLIKGLNYLQEFGTTEETKE